MRIRESRGKVSRKTRRGPRGQKLWFNQSGDSVTLWQHTDQEGQSWILGEGTHIGGDAFSNDIASSINVPAGMKATLHKHHRTNSAFNPDDAVTINGPSSQNLTDLDFNDQLSEIDVENMGTPDADDTGSTQQSDYDQAQDIETFLFNAKLTDFDWVCYADRYEDLKNAFGYDTVALKNHFVNHGYSEGRDPSCGEGGYSMPDSEAIDYAKDKWGYSEEQAQELLDYVYDKILDNQDWMAGEQEKATRDDQPLFEQLMDAANWQLYKKEGCKYCADDTMIDGGMPEQKAGLFSGTTGMIILGIAVVGIGYAIYRRNRAGQV